MKKISIDQLLINSNIEPTAEIKFFIPIDLAYAMIALQGPVPNRIEITEDDGILLSGIEAPDELGIPEEWENIWSEQPYSYFVNGELEDFAYDYIEKESNEDLALLRLLFTQYVILKNWTDLFVNEHGTPEFVVESSILAALVHIRKEIFDFCLPKDGDTGICQLHVLKVINDDFYNILKRLADFDLKYRDEYVSILDMVRNL